MKSEGRCIESTGEIEREQLRMISKHFLILEGQQRYDVLKGTYLEKFRNSWRNVTERICSKCLIYKYKKGGPKLGRVTWQDGIYGD